MKRLVFSTLAAEDLDGILHFIAADNPNAASAFVDHLESECESLARFPELGERQERLAPGLRRYCYRSYAIYYRNLEDAVRIERVLHGAVDARPDRFT